MSEPREQDPGLQSPAPEGISPAAYPGGPGVVAGAIRGAATETQPPGAGRPAAPARGGGYTTNGHTLAISPKTVLPVLFLGGLLAAGWVVASPFLPPLAWAVLIAYATWPVYARMRRSLGGRGALAAAAMTLLCALVLFAPLVGAGWAAQREARDLYRAVQAFVAAPPAVPEWLGRVPGLGTWLQDLRAEGLSRPDVLAGETVKWLKARLGDVASMAGEIGKNLGKMVIALMALFFVYRDCERLSGQVQHVLARVLGARAQRYLAAAGDITRAVVYGLLVTALAQGAFAGLGYWMVGLPAPILFGAVTAVFALVPFGTPLAWGSAGLWLLLRGDTTAGVGLLLWGALVVSHIDNIVRPMVISATTEVPFLLVLIGVLGGVLAFGLIGLFLGPIVLAVLLAVWREWAESVDPGLDGGDAAGASPGKPGSTEACRE